MGLWRMCSIGGRTVALGGPWLAAYAGVDGGGVLGSLRVWGFMVCAMLSRDLGRSFYAILLRDL